MSEAPTARSLVGDLPHPLPCDSPLIPNACQTQPLAPSFEPPPQDYSHVATLLVRHLPEAIPYDVLSRLFSHYGASSLRPCSGGGLRNCAFIDFKDEISASQAQSQLNRLRFLGKVLSVERVGRKVPDASHHRSQGSDTAYAVKGLGLDASLSGNLLKESVGTAYPMSEAIAPKLGVDYPFPSHLEYAYPPPDGNILTNIVNALIAVPRFYTQVLHLMNKMNIPAPFRVALPTPPLPTTVTFQPPPPSSPPPHLPNLPSPRLEDLSSDESELESPEEGDANENVHLGKDYTSRKRRRRQSIVGPAVDKGVAHEAVGLKPAALVPKEVLMIKKKSSVLQIKIAPKSLQCERRPPESSINEKNVPTCDESEERPFATTEEIEAGKLPAEEILSLPMFKNFIPGNPTPVLYIKNLAKNVVHEDFYFIFGSVFGNIEVTKRSLDIKLMQEGRMKGQAFVTFPSIDLANKALNLVNGYVYKGKPMIIQFGRNSAAAMKVN